MLKPTKKINPGFTVLEVMIAVSIIALLAALLIYGLGFMTSSAKNRQTKIMLGDARGMLQEFDTSTALNRDSGNWQWLFIPFPIPPQVTQMGNPPGTVLAFSSSDNPANLPTMPPETPTADYASLGLNFWRAPMRYDLNAPIGTLDANDPPSPMILPSGSFSTDSGTKMRNESWVVLYTQLAMKMIGTSPASKGMLAGIPTSGTMVPQYDASVSYYAIGNEVQYKGLYFECVRNNTLAAPPSSNSSNASWRSLALTPGEAPDVVLLDAWGNPIIMAPASGVILTANNGKPAQPYQPSTPNGPITAFAPFPGIPINPATQRPPITAPDNKPFFISAGPDGDFSTGDDNIYSFD